MDDKQNTLSFSDTDDWLLEVISQAVTRYVTENNIEQEKLNKFDKKFAEIIPEIVLDLSESISKSIKSNAPEILSELRKERLDFECHIFELWEEPFDLLETFLGIVFEIGEKFNRLFRPTAAEDNDYKFEVLVRLHARGCQIAQEILLLLKGGYPDGAHARWRTLHEIAATSLFIAKHDNNVAERYILYDYIESYKTANMHRQCYKGYGEEPPTDEELEKLRKIKDDLCNRFGENFKERYGWASHLGIVQFSGIEKDVDLDHMRPYYKLSSNNVHADPKGVMFKLGTFGVSNAKKTILTGPSVFGFTEAGHSTAISMYQITYALLSIRETLEKYLILRIISNFENEIGEAFFGVQKQLESKQKSI